MIRTQIYIPDSIHQAAKMLAQEQDRSLAELLRQIIVYGLKEERKKIKPKSLAPLTNLKITGGQKNLSANIDKYIY